MLGFFRFGQNLNSLTFKKQELCFFSFNGENSIYENDLNGLH